tara:strand:+ start:545 stop:787 length:243 start_codon:yes stop_codon:yes gene_type:complete
MSTEGGGAAAQADDEAMQEASQMVRGLSVKRGLEDDTFDEEIDNILNGTVFKRPDKRQRLERPAAPVPELRPRQRTWRFR